VDSIGQIVFLAARIKLPLPGDVFFAPACPVFRYALIRNSQCNHNSTGGQMIDEIDYFPKRDRYGKKKKPGEEWNSLKKLKESEPAKPAAKKPAADRPAPQEKP
jgi:hypothetical protein